MVSLLLGRPRLRFLKCDSAKSTISAHFEHSRLYLEVSLGTLVTNSDLFVFIARHIVLSLRTFFANNVTALTTMMPASVQVDELGVADEALQGCRVGRPVGRVVL